MPFHVWAMIVAGIAIAIPSVISIRRHHRQEAGRTLVRVSVTEVLATGALDGYTVVAQTPTALIMKGRGTNHVLHLILTLITGGLWLPVWLIVILFGRSSVVTYEIHDGHIYM